MRRRKGLKPCPPEARFWDKVDRRGPDECWPWQGGTVAGGYGQIRGEGRGWIRAHRLSFQMAHGRPVAPGLIVLHTCDNPPCVNPAHLVEGTYSDNSQDCVRKGRHKVGKPDNTGTRNGMSKLDESMVKVIRQRYAIGDKKAAIAADLGVTKMTVYDVIAGRGWVHVPMDESTRLALDARRQRNRIFSNKRFL